MEFLKNELNTLHISEMQYNRGIQLISQLNHWDLLLNSDIYEGEEGLCFSWSFVGAMCEILDNKVELYIGKGEGENIADYRTILYEFDTMEEFFVGLKGVLIR